MYPRFEAPCRGAFHLLQWAPVSPCSSKSSGSNWPGVYIPQLSEMMFCNIIKSLITYPVFKQRHAPSDLADAIAPDHNKINAIAGSKPQVEGNRGVNLSARVCLPREMIQP